MSKKESKTVEAESIQEGGDWDKDAIIIADGEDRLYFKCDAGNIITGFLNGEASYEDNDGRMVEYFVFHTDRETFVTSADVKEPFKAPKGSMVYVNKRAQLLQLEDFAGTDEVVWAGIEPVKKRPIKGGRTVWSFKMAVKPTGRRRPKMALPARATVESETPF